MNRIRDFVSLAILLTLIATAIFQLNAHNWSPGSEPSNALNRIDSKRQMVISLSEDWTSFQLTANTSSIKLLSNAVINAELTHESTPTRLSPRKGYRYAVEYELLDCNDRSLRHGTYHFRSEPKEKLNTDSGEVLQSIRLAGSSGLVAQSRIMETEIDQELKTAKVIRLRIGETEDSVAKVLTRVLCKSLRKNYDRFGAWEAISENRKEQLTRHSVYEHRLLDEDSRKGLIKWKWDRALPYGEFDRTFLYKFDSQNSTEVTEKPLPQGTIVQSGWKTIVPVDEAFTSLRVEATPLDESSLNIGMLRFSFDDPVSSERITGSQKFKPTNQSNIAHVEIHDVTGLVELETDANVALRFFGGDSSTPSHQWIEFELDPSYLPVYVADGDPVVYSVSHIQNEVTPLKVAFRFTEDQYLKATSSKSKVDRPRRIRWRYVSDDGRTIGKGVEELNPVVSRHERFSTEQLSFSVTDPIDLWFPVPPTAAKVEFRSEDSHALISAYARPNGLPAQTRVPEDYDDIAGLDSPFRRWFVLRPQNFHHYVTDNRVLNLKVQTRLEDIDEEEQPEGLTWNRFQPNGDWLAARIFVPTADPSNPNIEKPDSDWLWHELRSEEAVSWSTLERTSQYNNARIAFLSDLPAEKIEIWNSGQLVATKRFASTRGEFEINLTGHQGLLHVVSNNGVRVFVSGLDMDSDETWFRRTAMRIEKTPTVFEYEKKTWEDEFLTLVLYRDETETSRAGITAKIVPQETTDNSWQPRSAWTIRNRSYDVSPIPVANSLLIDRPGKLDSGSRCYMKLGSDLPPGKYDIEVQREDKLSGYLLLYQTIPQENTVRRIGIYDKQNQ